MVPLTQPFGVLLWFAYFFSPKYPSMIHEYLQVSIDLTDQFHIKKPFWFVNFYT